MGRPHDRFYLERSWGIQTYRAYLPPPLPPNSALNYSGNLPRLIGDAAHALGMLGAVAARPDAGRLIGSQYIRREAVLSSQIEGAQSSVAESLLIPHLGGVSEIRDEDAEIENCIDAMIAGLREMGYGAEIGSALLCRLHAKLLRSDRGRDKNPGRFRSRQNWIGGIDPVSANYVPPPPENVGGCMGDLESFIGSKSSDMHPLVRAGLAHAQFESIHPFEDGNGRIGRLLVVLMLIRDGLISQPILYLSQHLKAERQSYYRLLDRTREFGDWESWLGFFLEAIVVAANDARRTAQRCLVMYEDDIARIESSSRSALTARVHRFLLASPIASIAQIRTEIDASYPGIADALAKLQELGIVSVSKERKRNRYFVYDECLDIVNENT